MARQTSAPTDEAKTEANTEAPVQPTKEQLQDDEFIKHLPLEHFGARVITEAQWASIGISQGTVEWNELNGWRLPKSMFQEDALNYLLNVDDGFKVVPK